MHGAAAMKSATAHENLVTSEKLEIWFRLCGARISPSPCMLVSLVLQPRRSSRPHPSFDFAESEAFPSMLFRREEETRLLTRDIYGSIGYSFPGPRCLQDFEAMQLDTPHQI